MKKMILNNRGSALTNALALSVAVGIAAVMVNKTGKLRGVMDRDVNQNTAIESAMYDIKTYLANERNCKLALDDNFNSLGEYSVGVEVANGVSIETIKDLNPGERNREISIVFVKKNSKDQLKRRPDKVSIQLFTRSDPTNPGNSIDTCTSYETTGVDDAMVTMCETLGGTYNSATGLCDPNYNGPTGDQFKLLIDQLACVVVGGNLVAGTCDRVNIGGSLQFSHFRLTNISLGSTNQTNSLTLTCPAGQLVIGIGAGGNLSCQDISCPKPVGGNASDYSFRQVGQNYFCQCSRNRGPAYDCGSRFPSNIGDGLGCQNEIVDDGCGTGQTCTILKKNAICPGVAGCDEVIRDDCNDVCSVGPRSDTWSPSLAGFCPSESVTQSNDCGNTRTLNGTSTSPSCTVEEQSEDDDNTGPDACKLAGGTTVGSGLCQFDASSREIYAVNWEQRCVGQNATNCANKNRSDSVGSTNRRQYCSDQLGNSSSVASYTTFNGTDEEEYAYYDFNNGEWFIIRSCGGSCSPLLINTIVCSY